MHSWACYSVDQGLRPYAGAGKAMVGRELKGQVLSKRRTMNGVISLRGRFYKRFDVSRQLIKLEMSGQNLGT